MFTNKNLGIAGGILFLLAILWYGFFQDKVEETATTETPAVVTPVTPPVEEVNPTEDTSAATEATETPVPETETGENKTQ